METSRLAPWLLLMIRKQVHVLAEATLIMMVLRSSSDAKLRGLSALPVRLYNDLYVLPQRHEEP